jgi:hypothetical protein
MGTTTTLDPVAGDVVCLSHNLGVEMAAVISADGEFLRFAHAPNGPGLTRGRARRIVRTDVPIDVLRAPVRGWVRKAGRITTETHASQYGMPMFGAVLAELASAMPGETVEITLWDGLDRPRRQTSHGRLSRDRRRPRDASRSGRIAGREPKNRRQP